MRPAVGLLLFYKEKSEENENRDECTQQMFYGVENKGNMIAGVIGYDSIRKHLADCVMNTVEIREKYYLR